MSTQVIRVETFTKGSLGRIGGETERTSKHHRNEDIDDERTPDGKVRRNSKGSPVQAKGEDGKSKYEYVELGQPRICHSEFWDQRGGQHSYGNLQDDFYLSVSCRYGLGRGEVGSNRKHTTKYE